MEELVLGHFRGLRVVPDEDHVGLLVVPGEEEVQQDEEALGQVLARLVHRAGHIHQTEHRGLAGGQRFTHAVAVAQVERVEEGNTLQALAQQRHLCFGRCNLGGRCVVMLAQLFQVGQRLAQLATGVATHGDAPAQRHPHRANHVQAGGIALRDITGTA